MSIRALEHVVKNVRVGGFAQGVLLYLARCHNDKTGQCNPSRENMREFFSAEDAPCTIKRIDRALADLRLAGAIESKKVRVANGVLNFYSFPGIDNVQSSDTEGVEPNTGVTPKTGGSPQAVQGVDPKMGVFEQTQNGGCNREVEKGIEKELSLSEFPQSTPPKKKSKALSGKRGSRLTVETLPEDWRDFCEKEDPELDPQRVFENFKDYWTSQSGTKAVKADWVATWRNCVRSYRNAESWKRNPMLRASIADKQRKDNLGKKINGQTQLLTVQERKEANDWGLW